MTSNAMRIATTTPMITFLLPPLDAGGAWGPTTTTLDDFNSDEEEGKVGRIPFEETKCKKEMHNQLSMLGECLTCYIFEHYTL